MYSSRYVHWNITLYFILTMTIALIPFYIGYYVISNLRIGELDINIELSAYSNADLIFFIQNALWSRWEWGSPWSVSLSLVRIHLHILERYNTLFVCASNFFHSKCFTCF